MRITFQVFNFRIAHAIRKYFNNENFMIYGIQFMCVKDLRILDITYGYRLQDDP